MMETATWQDAERIAESDDVAEAIGNFAKNQGSANAVVLVRAVMNATRNTPTPSSPHPGLVKAADDVLQVLLRRWIDEGVTLNTEEIAKVNALRIELNKFK